MNDVCMDISFYTYKYICFVVFFKLSNGLPEKSLHLAAI